MIVVVLTGGIGSGKSTAAGYFRSRGAVTIDLDDIASHVMSPDSDTLASVTEAFGADVVGADGALDRKRLALVAFANQDAARTLDSIVHPAIAREVGPAIANLRLLPQPPEVVVLEVPLLVEAPVFGVLADVVLALEAPEAMRVERAAARGILADEARRRLAVQATDQERAALADEVIVNDGSIDDLRGRLAAFWQRRVAPGGAA